MRICMGTLLWAVTPVAAGCVRWACRTASGRERSWKRRRSRPAWCPRGRRPTRVVRGRGLFRNKWMKNKILRPFFEQRDSEEQFRTHCFSVVTYYVVSYNMFLNTDPKAWKAKLFQIKTKQEASLHWNFPNCSLQTPPCHKWKPLEAVLKVTSFQSTFPKPKQPSCLKDT
jgi:hypothetical protein